MIVRGMLGRPFRSNDPSGAGPSDPSQPSPYAYGSPLQHFDGHFFPSWPEQRFPLPLPSEEEQATDMVYVFQAPDVRGKFDSERAKALKVPNGPIRGKLTRGETVEVDDPEAEGGKRLVRPEDCLIGGGPGAVSYSERCPPGPSE